MMQIGVETQRLVETKRVFVVDDDDITRTVLQFMLQDDNETHEWPDLTAAYAKGEQARPDLVLLGLSVLDAHGTALLADLAARWPQARILLVTAPDAEAVAQGHVGLGAHGVLSKPFRVEGVRRKVDIQLGRVAPMLVQLGAAP